MKKILCNFSKYTDNKKENGYSLAYFLFYQTFDKLGFEVKLFTNTVAKRGAEEMNRDFLIAIKEYTPDIVFSMNISDTFDKSILLQLKNNPNIISLCWMSDDQWRFDTLGKKCIGFFDYIITTDPLSHPKYKKLGQKSILSEYGIKKQDLRKPSNKYNYDVTFIGGKNSWRKFIIDELKRKGIKVECFGSGWKNGRVSFNEMYNIFNTSKINLNLSNSVHYNMRYIFSGILHWKKQNNILDIFRPIANIILSRKTSEQIKARFFEVMGAGGFLLSYDLEDLENYFNVGIEIETYLGGNIDNIVEKIDYHLSNNTQREKIAENGFNKIKDKYTFEKTLGDIVQQISGK